MSERRGGRTNGSAGAGRDGSRLRELAEFGALEGHVRAMHNSHEMSNIAPDPGHVISAPAADWGFSTCPHPDCVLVRLAVPDPLASDTRQEDWRAHAERLKSALPRAHSQNFQFGYDSGVSDMLAVVLNLASAPLASSSETQEENTNMTTKI